GSPDGLEVAYGSYRTGNINMFTRRADAGAEEKVLMTTPQHDERPSDWSRDGQYILYARAMDPKNRSDLWFLKRNEKGDWQPHPFLQTSANETAPKLSPDGRYVAYVSDESGRDEIYVRPFPEGTRKWPVCGDGGTQVGCQEGAPCYVE